MAWAACWKPSRCCTRARRRPGCCWWETWHQEFDPMKLERIAYVLKSFPKISETFIAEELAELRRRGVQVRILSLEPPRREPRHDLVASAGLEPITCYEPNNFLAALK